MTILTVLAAILGFGIIIMLHEAGHFFVAKKCGIRVLEFSIGMGPAIFSRQKGETKYSLRILPIGGYCAMEGEDENSDDPRAFRKQAVWKRMLVTVAGAVMNLILGFVLIFGYVCLDQPMTSTKIAQFRTNDAGESISTSSQWLQENDRFVSINGLKIFTWQDISYALQNDTCDTFQVTVERNGQLLTYDDVTFLNTETQGLLDFYLLRDEKTPLTIISHTCKYYLTTARLIWISLVDLLSGKYGFHDLSGVVGIIDATTTVVNMSETFREKLTTMFDILGFITINVGIFNLIPFPALDGGRLVFLIVEAIRRKPCPAKVEGMIHFCGLAALMLLMVVITFQDITKIFTR
ncbi:MAG: site-2 protease family protein [Oscillospiraceae bacterium]|nr:site-2 protease family protein [Oscillospiraceae bacterium]